MSILFGYINLNDKPVERTTLETMKKAMDFWGPDGEGMWVEENCGLGNLLYYNTPEALFEKLPVTDLSGNLVMTAGARIDNREELFRLFDIPLGQRLTMPDSALMLKAYEKWGEACADHLVGDWAMAIWDRRERKLFLARDHQGITAMYYYQGENFFVFSSSLKGLLCLPQVPKKINEYKIAQLLVNWNEGGPTTCYLDIMRLPPAHTLTLHQGKATTNRYWYLEHTPEVRLKNDQEYADMFLDLYTEAVRCRLRSHRPVGATLSSGLDSGSVCILAAKELAKKGKRLQAYTAVPLYDVPVPPNRIGNEGPLAMALAEKLGNVDVTLCNAEGIGVLEAVEDMLWIIEQPNFGTANAFWILNILQKCQNSNIGTLLIGENGNGTVSWPPLSLLYGKNYFKNKLRAIKGKLKFSLGFWEKDFLLTNDAIRVYKIKDYIQDIKLPRYFFYKLSQKESRSKIIKPGSSISGDLWNATGINFKIESRDPTTDLKLMNFLFGIPDELPFSNNRNLFIKNFNNYFSDELFQSKIRGIQSVDLVKRVDQIRLNTNFERMDSGLFSSNKIMKFFLKGIDRNAMSILLLVYAVRLFNEKLNLLKRYYD